VLVTAQGDIDGLTAPRLTAALARAFAGLGERLLVLDLTSIGFMGSAGLRTLTEATAAATREHGPRTLRVVVDNTRPVIRPIEIVGLDEVLTLHETVDEALAAGEHS
jgi:anti-sigma B factor antagonist